VALRAQSPVAAPSPVHPGAGRSSVLPRDPGRATESLYRRHGDTVFRYAWHLLGRREDAEDATQATFLAVHKSLAGGTAVLDSSSWVLRIARNECMGRLRQTARRPAVSLDDGFDPPAAGGVERAAELRDEVRTAQKTLGSLPEPEREAFVMREWLGLEAGETALALGLNAGDVDGLASRARRSLVLAVGGLEPPLGCTGTRAALEAGSLDRAAKVHLLRCPVCRGVRRALRPPDAAARPVVVERLSAAIPGFATGGGGILAALTAKAATAPVLAKTAAIVVAAVAAGGAAEQAIVNAGPTHHGRSHGGQAQIARPAPAKPTQRSGAALVVQVTPPRTTHASAISSPVRPATARGAAATPTGRHGSSGSGSDHGGRSSGSDDTGAGNSGPGKAGGESGDHNGSGGDDSGASASGKHEAGGDSASSGKGKGKGAEGGADETSGSGKAGGSDGTAAVSGDSGSGKDSGSADVSGSGDSGTSGSGKGSADDGTAQTHGGDDGSQVVTDPAAASSGGGGSD
jgi:RNA polymerase sigma factor (sigma-70 family)